MGNNDELNEGRPDNAADDDDTLMWLDELASRSEESLRDSTILSADEKGSESEKGQDFDIPDWLKDDGEDAKPVEDILPDWLTADLAEEVGKERSSIDEVQAQIEDVEDATINTESAQEATISRELPKEPSKDPDQEAILEAKDDSDDLSWLEQIAIGGGDAIEEPVTMSWDENEEDMTGRVDETLVGDVAWLDGFEPEETLTDMAATEGSAVEGEGRSEIEDQQAPGYGSGTEFDEGDVTYFGEMPEDPDEAMEWLEQLAARQGAPLEELPSLYEEAADSPVEEEVVEEAVSEEQLDVDEELEAALAELSDIELPTSEDEALSWLGVLAVGGQDQVEDVVVESDVDVVEEIPTPETPHDVVAERAAAEALIMKEEREEISASEMVDFAEDEGFRDEGFGEEDALAWLDSLATPGDETLDSLEEEPVDKSKDEISDLIEDTIEPQAGEEESELIMQLEAGLDPESIGDDWVPDWLEDEDHVLAVEDDIDWLDDLDEGLLVAEVTEEVDIATEESVSEDVVSELEDYVESEVIAEAEVTVDVEADEPALALEDLVDETPIVEVDDIYALDLDADLILELEAPADINKERLAIAHASVERGNIEEAFSAYSELLEEGKGLPYLIADLESKADQFKQAVDYKRILGDAYARNGQLSRALDTYKTALEQL